MSTATVSLTALQLERQYKQLGVALGNGQSAYVAVSHYRNNSSASPDHSTVEAKEKAMKPLIAALRAQSKADLGLKKKPTGTNVVLKRPAAEVDPLEYAPGSLYQSVDVGAIARTFVGKGSPADIAGTLALAVRFGLVGGTTAALQKYVDDYVGLDCSGFVTNFLNLAYDAGIDVMNKSATSYREPAANRVGAIDDIEPHFIMAWATTNHVAVIESLDADWLRLVAGKTTDGSLVGLPLTVVESNGSRGLNHATYTVQSVDANKVFKVKRSYENGTWKVYILSRPV
jgi:hypothetical protein